MMTPLTRKFVLTIHIIFSVGWIGALAGFLVFNIVALTSQDTQMTRSAFLAMDLIGWYVILPACLGSLLTGLIQSLCSSWGLFKHYWVLVKFILTSGATFLLILHMRSISQAGEFASVTPYPSIELHKLGTELLVKAAAALLVLFVVTTISVYKPWGMTTYGLRKQQMQSKRSTTLEPEGKNRRRQYLMIGLICLVLLFIIIHLLNGGMGGH